MPLPSTLWWFLLASERRCHLILRAANPPQPTCPGITLAPPRPTSVYLVPAIEKPIIGYLANDRWASRDWQVLARSVEVLWRSRKHWLPIKPHRKKANALSCELLRICVTVFPAYACRLMLSASATSLLLLVTIARQH